MHHAKKPCNEVLDGGAVDLGHEEGFYVQAESEILQEDDNMEHPNVEFNTNDFLPNWNLLPAGDFLPDQSVPHETTNKDNSSPPLSYPTFNLLS